MMNKKMSESKYKSKYDAGLDDLAALMKQWTMHKGTGSETTVIEAAIDAAMIKLIQIKDKYLEPL